MSERGYVDAVNIIYSPLKTISGDGESLPESHNGGGIVRTVKRLLNQFSDDALKKLALTSQGQNQAKAHPELYQITRNILHARHGADDSTEKSVYYSTDINELKAAAKATRSKKLRQQIENKIKRIRRRRRKAAQIENSSLEKRLDAV